MAREARDGVLLERDWVPVVISGSQFLSKAWFGETAYHVVLTDLQGVWEEDMDSQAIEDRAQELNKRLRAPVRAFFSHLCQVAQPCLSGRGGGGAEEEEDGEARISLTRQDTGLNMRLKSKLDGLPFHWEFRCTPAPLALVCSQLLRPLLVMSRLLQRQVDQLTALLVRKDSEILDYRENGALLSRERLQTEVFEEHSFRQKFLSQELSEASVLQQGCRLDPELRDLYAAVASAQRSSSSSNNARKRRLSEQPAQEDHHDHGPADHGPAERSPSPGEAVSGQPGQGDRAGASASQRATQPQTQAPPAAASVQPASRPKKKKALGLFR